jgi:hypothetical protein
MTIRVGWLGLSRDLWAGRAQILADIIETAVVGGR